MANERNDIQRGAVDAIADEIRRRKPQLASTRAREVAQALVTRVTPLCFENWFQFPHMDKELLREFTLLLAKQFHELDLGGAQTDFVPTAIELLKKRRYQMSEAEAALADASAATALPVAGPSIESPPLPTPRYLAIKAAMMPRDTNPHGTIFGGVLLSYIDQAGAVGARHEIRRAGWPDRKIVTVAMNRVEFHKPVFVGDIVSFWTEVTRVGNTSITVRVTVEAERDGNTHKLTEAEVTYVAVELDDGERRPVPIRG